MNSPADGSASASPAPPLDPKLVIADEPVSALDVSVRSQVLNLMVRLQRERNLTYVFISHDLSVVEHVSDSIAIMYLGRIVEKGPVNRIFGHPAHPYTRALLEAIPVPDPERRHQGAPVRARHRAPHRLLAARSIRAVTTRSMPAASRFHLGACGRGGRNLAREHLAACTANTKSSLGPFWFDRVI
jgi:ABC-type dipeptide/oligopeptide/nickel transport system ATPase component